MKFMSFSGFMQRPSLPRVRDLKVADGAGSFFMASV